MTEEKLSKCTDLLNQIRRLEQDINALGKFNCERGLLTISLSGICGPNKEYPILIPCQEDNRSVVSLVSELLSKRLEQLKKEFESI